MQNNLLSYKISVIFITVGITSENKKRRISKYLDFNNSTIFLHDPSIKQIQELISNISNVSLTHENLIYERF